MIGTFTLLMEEISVSRLLNISLCLRFQELGFEKGWGDTAKRVLDTMLMLLDLLEAPDPCTLEKFLGTIPMVFNVVIMSPHGYFAQANVLGYPDTGGQVQIFEDQQASTWSGSFLLLLIFFSFFFTDCLHFRSSPSLGERDASSDKAARPEHHSKNSHRKHETLPIEFVSDLD